MLAPPRLVVDTLSLEYDGDFSAGQNSLVEAISFAGANTITFDASLTGATFYLDSTVFFNTDAIIDGEDKNITFSGDSDNNGTPDVRVFQVSSGRQVTLKNLTITKGVDNCNGGGIFSDGDLTILNSTFTDHKLNGACGGGAAIWANGALTVANSTFSDNDSNNWGAIQINSTAVISNSTFNDNHGNWGGGAIFISAGSVTMTNNTLSGNTAGFGGGGAIYIDSGTVTMLHNTLSGNMAHGSGDGIHNRAAATLTLQGNIVANNDTQDCINDGTVVDNGFNLIEDTGDACGLSNGVNNNIVGQDPELGSLADNGGPTLTHRPSATSPAIDAGSGCTSIDQRGEARPYNDLAIANVADGCDIGAVEIQASDHYTIPISSIMYQDSPAQMTLNWAGGNGCSTFVLWRSNAPYTGYTAVQNDLNGMTAMDDLTNQPLANLFYYIQASDCAGLPTSTPIGIFHFGLEPGN